MGLPPSMKMISVILTAQTTISHAFSGMKMYEFRLRFHWSLFLRFELTIFQHWFRWRLGADRATSRYLNHWWSSLLTHACVTRPHWVKLWLDQTNIHYNDVTWAAWRFKTPASRLLFNILFSLKQRENQSSAHYLTTGPLWRKPTGDGPMDSPHKEASNAESVHVVTSSWTFNPTFTVWASARSSGSIILKLSMTIETLSQSRTWNCNFFPWLLAVCE